MNWKQPPSAALPSSIRVPQAESVELSNGVKVFEVNEGTADVCRVDFLFAAGSREQSLPLQASGTLALLTEGSEKRTAQQIAEQLEFLGSYLNRSTFSDFARLTLFSLNRNLGPSLALIQDFLFAPSFPQSEIDIWSATGLQELSVNLDKTATLAQREFIRTLFGDGHPYTLFANPSDYAAILRNDLMSFHESRFIRNSCQIILSGRITDTHLQLLELHFGQAKWGEELQTATPTSAPKAENRHRFVHKPNSIQSSIRLGRTLFPRTHPDYAGMSVVTTLLGGFFGSRLMKNLREEKGFTYGVRASLLPFMQANVLQIGTDVGSAHTRAAIDEIIKELNRLRNEPVGADEMELVKGSMIGSLLRALNGPFNIAEGLAWLLYFNNLDYKFYDNMLHTINNITPQKVAELANMWLQEEDLTIIVAGVSNPFN